MFVMLVSCVQLVLIVPIVIGVMAITLAASFIRKRNESVDDDLGYLERIYSESRGGESNEKDI